MLLFVSDVTSGATFGMLEKSLAFTEARNRMLAENIANATTPGYRTQQLDVSTFRAELKAAARRQDEDGGQFRLKSSREFRMNDAGRLEVNPSLTPVENLLFHDGTNARIEHQMSQLAENTMMHQVTSEILRGYFEGIRKAIRGRIG